MTKKTVLTIAAALMATASYAANPDAGTTLSDNQTFTYRVLDEFPTLDPQLVEETVGADITRDLFEGLLNQDKDGNLIPGVALSYEATDGNKVFTFKLREDAK